MLQSPIVSSPITISLATPADRHDVLHLLTQQFAEHDIHLGDQKLGYAIDGLLAEPRRGRILVARIDGRIVGLAAMSYLWTLEHGAQTCWLDELYVEPDLRERKIGTQLLHAAYKRAEEDGCIAMDLEVDVEHSRAANLYRREGFIAHARSRFVRLLGAARDDTTSSWAKKNA